MSAITITLNDKQYELATPTSVANFIDSLGISTKGTALAIDFEVIPKDMWATTQLCNGNELMLIHAVSGG